MIILRGRVGRIMLQLDKIKITIIFFYFKYLNFIFHLLKDNLLVTYRLRDFWYET
jgi:hypothetical protein